jgi:chromosomal replication initiator protein
MTVVLSLWRGQMLAKVKTAREIIAEVAESHGLTPAHFESPIRTKRVAHARQEAMWACRQVKGRDGKPRYSYPFIGRLLGGRDHTTVLYGERQHAARLAAERVAA